jgi:hypothetical protein
MVPEKPFRAVTVMVETADRPAVTAEGDVALIEKSWGALKTSVIG